MGLLKIKQQVNHDWQMLQHPSNIAAKAFVC